MGTSNGMVITGVTHESSTGLVLSQDQEAQLLEAIAEAERGETISAEDLFDRLDRAAAS